ncbi:hypothetical protein [Paenibacillus filicis]|uniref:hypothetical protein n=1 Tax=Paenibacillus filicis TaxID=669464 RepID=UPI003119D69E
MSKRSRWCERSVSANCCIGRALMPAFASDVLKYVIEVSAEIAQMPLQAETLDPQFLLTGFIREIAFLETKNKMKSHPDNTVFLFLIGFLLKGCN